MIGPPFTGHFRQIVDTPRGLQAFQPSTEVKKEPGRPFQPTETALLKSYNAASEDEKTQFNLELGRNFYDSKGNDVAAELKEKPQANGDGDGATANGVAGNDQVASAIEERSKGLKGPKYCQSCTIDCTKRCFHYSKPLKPDAGYKELNLCSACFFSDRLSSGYRASDFVWIDGEDNDEVKNNNWTDAEIIALLEALENFDESWNQVADKVGTRTKEECVLKFLQLEIEDQYQETAVGGANYGSLDQGRTPFAQVENPIVSVLGYLVSLTEPQVAAEASGRSIKEMRKIQDRRIEAGQGGSPTKVPERSADSMEVDETPSSTAIAPMSKQQTDAAVTRDVANATFAAAAARASALASNEERELTRLVSAAVNIELEKMELKLKQFAEMESALQRERQELEKGRQQLFLDRLAFRKRVIETQEALRTAGAKGGEEGARMAGDINSGSLGADQYGLVKDGMSNAAGAEPPAGGVNFEI